MTSTQTSLAELHIPEPRDYPMFVDGAWWKPCPVSGVK